MKYYFPLNVTGMTLETEYKLMPDDLQDIATVLAKVAMPYEYDAYRKQEEQNAKL